MTVIDGFISMRAGLEPIAKQVQACLRDAFGLYAVMQDDLGKIDANNHRAAQQYAIDKGRFTIVLVSPEKRFDLTEGAGKVEQLHEISDAIEAAKRIVRYPGQQGHEAAVYPIVFALPDNDTLNAEGVIYHVSEKFAYQLEFAQVFGVNNPASPQSPEFRDSVLRLCRYVAQRVDPWVSNREQHEARAERRTPEQLARTRDGLDAPAWNAGPAPSSTTPSGPGGSQPAGTVEDYLSGRVGYWIAGQLGPLPDSDEQKKGPSSPNSPFAFSPDRLMQLRAKIRRDGTRPVKGEQERLPVHDLILRPRDMRPVYITGDAGAGKSITVTTSAAALASLQLPGLRREFSRLKGFEAGGPLSVLLDRAEPLVPIVLRCSEVATRLGAHPAPSATELLDAASASLPELPHFSQLIKDHPLAIFFDGLDEIADLDLRETFLEAISAFRRAYEDAQVKLIVTSRPSGRRPFSADFDYIHAALSAPEEAQANAFIRDYLSRTLEDDESQVILERIENQLQKEQMAALWNDIRERPLLLNVFCWFSRGGDSSIEDFGTFCKNVVDLLLTRDSIVCERTGANGSAERVIVPVEFARNVLRALAHNALISDYGARKVPASQAFSEVESLRSNLDDASLEGVEPRAILRAIELRTNLVKRDPQRDGDYYQVTPGLFAEYLTGESLAKRAGPALQPIRELVRSFNLDALETLLGPLQFAFALRMAQADPTSGSDEYLRIPDQLVARAIGTPNGTRSMKWLRAAGSMFSHHEVSDAALGDDGRGRVRRMTEDAVRTYKAHEAAMDPIERADAIEVLGDFCARRGARPAAEAVRGMLTLLAPDYQPWVRVPALDTAEDEFWIAAAPVLTAEYAEFVEARGGSAALWSHAPARETCLISEATEHAATGVLNLPPPRDLWNELRRHLLRPVVHLCWYEAVAYARWLEGKVAERDGGAAEIRLMTMDEWIAIAQIVSGGRKYVYGDDALPQDNETRFNCPKTNIGGPSPIGVFEPSASLPGLFDFGTNVSSLTMPPPEDGGAQWPPSRDPDEPPRTYIAGGAWNSLHDYHFGISGRCPKRSATERSSSTGLRLVKRVRRAANH